MKNHGKDARNFRDSKTYLKYFFSIVNTDNEMFVQVECTFFRVCLNTGKPLYKLGSAYFFKYITSFASFTVRGTSGKAAATRFGA